MIEILLAIAILISALLILKMIKMLEDVPEKPEISRPNRFLRHQNRNHKARNRVARVVSRDNPKMRRK